MCRENCKQKIKQTIPLTIAMNIPSQWVSFKSLLRKIFYKEIDKTLLTLPALAQANIQIYGFNS